MSGDYLFGLVQGWGIGIATLALTDMAWDWWNDRKPTRTDERNER